MKKKILKLQIALTIFFVTLFGRKQKYILDSNNNFILDSNHKLIKDNNGSN